MTATLLTFPVFRAFDSNGAPLAGGLLYSYQAGTTTPLATYVDQAGVTQNTNPVVLDSTGTANVWLGSSTYKLVLKDSDGVQQWSVDNIQSEGGQISSAVSAVYSDLANTSNTAKGDALIGVKSVLNGAVARTQHSKNADAISVEDFGAVGDGTTDDSDAIQAALNSITGYIGSVSLSPNKTYKITKPILIRRGRCLIGDGTSQITADYSSTNWDGDYVALKFIVDAVPTQVAVYGCMGQRSGGFRLIGANNSTVISYGIRIYTNQSIDLSVAVNYSFIYGNIENINIQKFDTAIWMQECWSSQFLNVSCLQCRVGLHVQGKSVGNTFLNFQATGFTKDNTSSTDETCGLLLESGFQYSGGTEGRPEGFMFYGGLIYGAYNNISIINFLQLSFNSVVVDGAVDNAVEVFAPEYVTFSNCYFYTSGVSKACINFGGVGAATSSSFIVEGCQFVGVSSNNTMGINFVNAGYPRQGVVIANNSAINLDYFVNAATCPNYSKIIGNYCESHSGTIMIYIQNGGVETIVDGNTCDTSSVYPLVCHPITDATLRVGKNASPTYSTYYAGKVTLTAGSTTIALPNNLFSSAIYLATITTATPNGNAGSWYVTEQTNWSNGTFTMGATKGTDIDIRYVVTAIPISAS